MISIFPTRCHKSRINNRFKVVIAAAQIQARLLSLSRLELFKRLRKSHRIKFPSKPCPQKQAAEEERGDKKVLKDNKSLETPIFQKEKLYNGKEIFIAYMAGKSCG